MDDFVSAMITAADVCQDDIINIGAGEEFSIKHFAGLIGFRVGYDPEAIVYDKGRYVGATSKCLSVERLRRLIPDLRFRTLEDGLAKTIDDFRARLRELPGGSPGETK